VQPKSSLVQLSLLANDELDAAVEFLATAGVEQRGAINTRREVVEFILDLVGYTPDRPLATRRLLEPSFGGGDFLLPAVERLLASHRLHSDPGENVVEALKNSIYAVELHRQTFEATKASLEHILTQAGIPSDERMSLLSHWLCREDFLLAELETGFDLVVGNPPYVRQELIPDALIEEYRRRYATIFDRADLYVPFIERSLALLAPHGHLGIICANRWIKNRYGGPLRQLVTGRYRLKYYVDMVGVSAFHSEVIAYPAVTVISREPAGPTRVARATAIERPALQGLAATLRSESSPGTVSELDTLTCGDAPWVLEPTDKLALVRRLEADFPSLEAAGCKVGIGVATGADKVFIAPFDTLDVESERKLPLVMTRDIESGTVRWRGLGVLNPFSESGELVQLSEYPKFAEYLARHGAVIKARHVSKKNPNSWYRTIDRIYPTLTTQPKLLIPDIKGDAHIVYEAGQYYPHHNLYYLTSQTWDLHALQAVLMSGIARLFVSTYSTKMHGGFLRFQAQYLRRIRLPRWEDVAASLRRELMEAATAGDSVAANDAVAKLFGLSTAERDLLLRALT
jgi:hypothetical protein